MTFYVKHNRLYAMHSDVMMTKQSCKAECDINNILSQYKKTGILNHINSNKPVFADLPDVIDYQQSLHILEHAENAFDALPSKIRDEFNNDPAAFLTAFSDPAKADRLRELGLLNPLPIAPTNPGATPPSPPGDAAPP